MQALSRPALGPLFSAKALAKKNPARPCWGLHAGFFRSCTGEGKGDTPPGEGMLSSRGPLCLAKNRESYARSFAADIGKLVADAVRNNLGLGRCQVPRLRPLHLQGATPIEPRAERAEHIALRDGHQHAVLLVVVPSVKNGRIRP